MYKAGLMTAEYYDAADMDRLIGAVYVPENSAGACASVIGKAILRALGKDCLTVRLLDADGNNADEMTVFRGR